MLKLKYEAVTSESRPEVKHVVTVVDWVRPVSCTCEDWKFHVVAAGQPHVCKHMRSVWRRLTSSLLRESQGHRS